MDQWASRPLDAAYAAVFVDAVHVKVRDGQVANRPVYAAIVVSLDGRKDVLGLWMGTGGEGAKFWMSVLMDLRNRGVADVFFLVCDGLKGLPEVVENVWPLAVVQTCVIHLIRTPSGWPHAATGIHWSETSKLSTPHRRSTSPRPRSTSSIRTGEGNIRP